MPFVTLLFLLANFAFFSILSSYDLRHVHSLSLHAGHTVLGQPGGFLMAGTVVASALGSINANIWAGSRLLAIMAKDNTIIPARVGKVWSRTGTQAIAILILIGQASIHAIINLDFKTFSKIYSAVGWSWYGLSIAGLLYLRKKRPLYPRPVKVFWPLAGAFILVAFFLVVGSLTLAFMGVSAPPPKGGEAEESNSVDRYMPVIMFSAVILFMTGVIPAFYLTRYINRRDQQKQSSQTQRSRNSSGGDSMNGGENPDDRRKRHDADDFDRTRNEKGFLPESPYGKHAHRNEQDNEPNRRFSTASSVTLVGESKREKNRRRQERQLRKESHHREEEDQQCAQSRPGPSRTNSHTHLKDEMEEEDEEEMVRIQALRGARLVHRRSIEGAETGESNRSSMDDCNYFLTDGSGRQCMSPYSTACPSENGTPMTSACPTRAPSPSPFAMEGGRHQQQLLGLPSGFRSGSRSSESTVGMDADYDPQEMEAQYYRNEQPQQRYRLERHASADSIEELTDQRPVIQVPEILFEHFTPATGVNPALRAEGSDSSEREMSTDAAGVCSDTIHPLSKQPEEP